MNNKDPPEHQDTCLKILWNEKGGRLSMKGSFKKIAVLLIMFILAVEVTTVSQEVNVSAASIRSTQIKAKKAYRNYARKYLLSSVSYPYGTYKLYDINRDGIPEMFFTYMAGVRGGYKIYTYKKGKIIKMLDTTGAGGLYRNAQKKQICISFSNGAADSWATSYKMQGKKLVPVRNYRSISGFKGTPIRF